ncbi:glutathione S-transferase [Sphingobium sp. SYK-6]|uniref:glutathione S-transferase family protein n=1 Tax=Sphingobium sp. (strain NBRC 103272 / SYK-6) TaxID=627192 RepID=UPI0002277A0F|nr:glutathione S-transferase family protein [Sphingobium sp. SYK-6]BAK68123.1 glutathione S-transferase [Sphingobium sp. SYK-6]
MGMMIDGTWHPGEVTEKNRNGSFERQDSGFRDWITPDGEAGPDGRRTVRAEAGRFHLYVSYACPWAHRALIVRALKGLDDMIGVSVVDPLMREHGWTFETARGGTGDALHGADYLWQIYARSRRASEDGGYTGKVTVPVLWDRQDERIVNNESSEIIRIFNHAFDDLGARPGDYYPAGLTDAIDAVNARVYETVNNGVYRCGFATTQQAYDAAIGPLFDTLDWLEERLGAADWLVGDRLTEADIRLFTSLIRFDPVYHGHFKCNIRRIADYPALVRFLHRMMDDKRIAGTVHFDHIKTHYYASHRDLNPSGIVPAGPVPLVPPLPKDPQ